MSNIDSVFVLIFNPGKQDEGVYTLQGRSTRSGAYVLAFERSDDAQRFASMLSSEGFDMATPMGWNKNQVSSFCAAGAFEISLVPQGTLVTPPSKNEYDTDAFEKLTKDPLKYKSERMALESIFDGPDGCDPGEGCNPDYPNDGGPFIP